MKKLLVLEKFCIAAVAVVLALGFAGCKHDNNTTLDESVPVLNGTWETMYLIGDGNKTVTYQASGATRRVVWNFKENSENIGDGGTFTQIIYNYGAKVPSEEELKDTLPEKVTFIFGKYNITGNQEFTKGKMYVQNLIMIPFHSSSTVKGFIEKYKPAIGGKNNDIVLGMGDGTYDNDTINNLITVMNNWTLQEFLDLAYGSEDGIKSLKEETFKYNEDSDGIHYLEKNGIMLQIKYANDILYCSDVEYFRYNLQETTKDGFAYMMVTSLDSKDGTSVIGRTYNQFINESTKLSEENKIKDNCLWTGCNTRYFGKISAKSPSINEPSWIGNSEKNTDELFPLMDSSDNQDYTPTDFDTAG